METLAMKKPLIASLGLAIVASFGLQAQDTTPPAAPVAGADASSASDNDGWKGSGEFGYASATGNSRTENANAKLGLSQENDYWKNNFYLNGLRSKGDTAVTNGSGQTVNVLTTTANRYDTGASVGYKLDPRSYIVGALRYEHDDFGANLWQGTASIGYGYILLKSDRSELSFEVGPGYKQYRPATALIEIDGAQVPFKQDSQSELVARSLINYKYRLTSNTALDDTLLIEAGSKNKYYQNDIGLSVNMTRKLAIKLGYQVRYNSDTLPGIKSTDTLTTTNVVYNF
jgi:putative salt-induced outer membrane protein